MKQRKRFTVFSFTAIISAIAVSIPCATAFTAPKEAISTETELSSIRASLEALRDSLQMEISERWRSKQKYVELREEDKEELSRLKEVQERAYAELSRVKEECLSKENSFRETSEAEIAQSEELRQGGLSTDEIFAKEAESIIEAFPLDIEERRSDLECLRRGFQRNQDAALATDRFIEYKTKYLDSASRLSLIKRSVLVDDGKTRLLTLARFGSAFAYGMSENGDFYFIRQSGRLGGERFRIDKIESESLRESLVQYFPQWVAAGSVFGLIPTDVLQNEQTKLLASGKKVTEYRKFIASIKAGGAVMIPLLLLPFWAIILIFIKLFQFTGKRMILSKQYKKVTCYLENNDRPGALAFVRSCKGTGARIFERCLNDRDSDRATMEKNIRELFIGELPRLNGHLNTLAVIAGAAPLLGLLGTISGMINLFGAVTHYGTGDPKFLAGGISEALITAKTGLMIAIPTLFVHDYLRNKKDRLQADIEKYALCILNRLRPRG